MQLTKHWAATLDDYVIDLAWSPDGTQLAAASAAGPIALHATADGAKRHELPGHEGGTNVVAFAPALQGTGDGRQEADQSALSPVSRRLSPAILASGGAGRRGVKFWDAAAGQHIATQHSARLGLSICVAAGFRNRGQRPRLQFSRPPEKISWHCGATPPSPILSSPRRKPSPLLAWQPKGGLRRRSCFGAGHALGCRRLRGAKGIPVRQWHPCPGLVARQQMASCPAIRILPCISGFRSRH